MKKVRIKANILRERRAKKVRKKIIGKAKLRLSVFRSHRHIYAQIIDDLKGKTLIAASSLEVKEKNKKGDTALAVGKILAEKAVKAGIKTVVFDRGRYRYHGRVKTFTEGARSGGLKF